MTTATYCAQHPNTETELRCGRCDKLICARCLVFTPGGTRCRDCAQLRRPVMYELAPKHYVLAIATSAVLAVALGLAGALVLSFVRAFGFFALIVAALVGAGAGGLMAEAITRVTRSKRGVPMQAIAAAGLVGAWVVRLMLYGGFEAARGDLIGIFAAAVAIAAAWQRLR